MRLPRHLMHATAAFALVALPVSAIAGFEGAHIAQGQKIVTEKCGRCHAVGPIGESTHAKAPPFREVVKRYPVENLAEALAEGIIAGHADMPVFVFDPPEIGAILAYLSSLGAPKGN